MYGDVSTGGLASLNPGRWSGYADAISTMEDIEKQAGDRPVKVQSKSGIKWDAMSVERAAEKLRATMMSVEEHRAWGMDRAAQKLPAFKEAAIQALEAEADADLLRNYGSRPDEFYLRFLQFHMVGPVLGDVGDGRPLAMFLNYCKFMQTQRVKGRLEGLGAAMIRPLMDRGFLRMLTTRDKQGRRVMLTFPKDMDEKVPEAERASLYLYWFLKLMTFDDCMDQGWTIVHDLTDITLAKVTAKILQSNEAKEMIVDNTFPWILGNVLFVNTPGWLSTTFNMLDPLFPKSVKRQIDHVGSIEDPENMAALAAMVDVAALPSGMPYNGGLDEGWDAALQPGLGVFFEPEMDPAENAPGPQ